MAITAPSSNGQRSNGQHLRENGRRDEGARVEGFGDEAGRSRSSCCKVVYNSAINPNTVNPISMDVVGLYSILNMI